MKCFDCEQEIVGVIVWLGEVDEDDQPFEHPFHETCADKPWPLYETRRSFSDEKALADHIADSVRDYLNATLPPGINA